MASLTDITGRSRVVPGLGPGFGLAAAILAVLTVIRLVGLKLSVVDLFFDEAQYWTWSRELAFGYFSKPPLLAWAIAAAERVCGGSEACIRAPAPIFYFGTSLLVYAVARHIRWNLQNDLATFRHTGDNIQGSGVVFDPRKGLEFIAAQFAVFGPILFAVLLAAIVRLRSPAMSRADRLMLAFSIPPLAL